MSLSQEELARSRQIEENFKLYKGEYSHVLRHFKSSDERRNSLEVIFSIAGALTRVFADLCFLEDIEIGHQDPKIESKLREIAFRSNFGTALWEAALSQSYAGFAAFEGRLEDGKAFLEEVSPAVVFPQFSRMNIKKKPSEIILSWPVDIRGEPHVFIKRHQPGLITQELRKKGEGEKDGIRVPLAELDPGLLEVEETGLDEIPLFIINNQKTGRDAVGVSDYADIRSLLCELTRVMSQIATQLSKFGDAKMAVPPGVLDENGRVRRRDFEMIEVGAGENGMFVPEYITNDNPQLDKAFQQVERIVMAICQTSEVSGLLLDLNPNGGAEKVGALRLRLLRTLAKVRRKTKAFRAGLQHMLATMLRWEGGATIFPTDIAITFRDGLPEDALEKIQQESLRLSGGFQTLAATVQRLDGLQGEALEKKLADIQEENRVDGPAIPEFSV